LYKKFQEELINAIQERIKDGNIAVHNVKKNNGIELIGITISQNDQNAVPTIYLDEYFENYCNGQSMEQTVDEIMEVYERYRLKEQLDLSFLDHYEPVRERIFLKAVNTEKNQELLKEVPHKDFMDLSLIPYFTFEEAPLGNASALIRNDFLKIWKVSAETVIQDALQNMKERYDYEFVPMSVLISRMIKEKEQIEGDKEFMYVLSPKKWNFGAALMAVSDIMENIAETIQSDYFVLPSSIHEIIVVPTENNDDLEKMTEMVTEVNRTSVDEQDFLSNRAYYYKRGVGYANIH